MSHLIKTLEKLGSTAQLKTATLKSPSDELHFLGVHPALVSVLVNKDWNKLAQLTKTRVNMCCLILRPPTTIEVFNKPIKNLASIRSDNHISNSKSVA